MTLLVTFFERSRENLAARLSPLDEKYLFLFVWNERGGEGEKRAREREGESISGTGN